MEQTTIPDLPPPVAPPSTALLVEALLFVAAEPLTVTQLAAAIEVPPDAIEAALAQLMTQPRGIQIQRSGDRIQLVSNPAAAGAIERLLGVQASTRLSAAALEALAVVAYRQPVTRTQIDAVRGVDSGGVLRVLLSRELITEVGRLETVGKPILYGTTDAFLRQFGLATLGDLPPLAVPVPPTEEITHT